MIYTLLLNNGQTISFDCVTSATQTYSAVITEHPVETSKSVTDHIYIDNGQLQLNGFVSDFNFYNPVKGQYGSSVYFDSDGNLTSIVGFTDIQTNIKTALLNIFNSKETVDVIIGSKPDEKLEILESYAISNLTFTDSGDNGNVLSVNMQLNEIVKVSVLTEYNTKLPTALTKPSKNLGNVDPLINKKELADAKSEIIELGGTSFIQGVNNSINKSIDDAANRVADQQEQIRKLDKAIINESRK